MARCRTYHRLRGPRPRQSNQTCTWWLCSVKEQVQSKPGLVARAADGAWFSGEAGLAMYSVRDWTIVPPLPTLARTCETRSDRERARADDLQTLLWVPPPAQSLPGTGFRCATIVHEIRQHGYGVARDYRCDNTLLMQNHVWPGSHCLQKPGQNPP